MERISLFDIGDGDPMEVLDRDLEAFKGKYPDAEPVQTFDVGDGGGPMEVLERDLEAFKAKYPEARRLNAVEMADGSGIDVAEGDEAAFLKAVRTRPEFAKDREELERRKPSDGTVFSRGADLLGGAAKGFGQGVAERAGEMGSVLRAVPGRVAAGAATGVAMMAGLAASGLGDSKAGRAVQSVADDIRLGADAWREDNARALERRRAEYRGDNPAERSVVDDYLPRERTAGERVGDFALSGADMAGMLASVGLVARGVGAVAGLAGASPAAAAKVAGLTEIAAFVDSSKKEAKKVALAAGKSEEEAERDGNISGLVDGALFALMGQFGKTAAPHVFLRAFEPVKDQALRIARRAGVAAAQGYVLGAASDIARQNAEGVEPLKWDLSRANAAGLESGGLMGMAGAFGQIRREVADEPLKARFREFDNRVREQWEARQAEARTRIGEAGAPAPEPQPAPAPQPVSPEAAVRPETRPVAQAPEAQPPAPESQPQAPVPPVTPVPPVPSVPSVPQDAAAALALTPEQAVAAGAAKAEAEAAPSPAEQALLPQPQAPEAVAITENSEGTESAPEAPVPPEEAQPPEGPERAEDRIRRVNSTPDTAFLTREGSEEALARIKEGLPEALEAKSLDELLGILARHRRDAAKRKSAWGREKSRMGVGYVPKEEQLRMLRQVHLDAAIARDFKLILEYAYGDELAAFRRLPPQEQVRRLGLGVKESGGRVVATGDTFLFRDELKEMGFKWDSAEKEWSIEAPAFSLDGGTMEEAAEERRRAEERAEIERRQAERIKGGTVNIQEQMDLGDGGSGDLFEPTAVADEGPKKVSEMSPVEKLSAPVPVEEAPVDSIEIDESVVPNFKRDASGATGLSEPLSGQVVDIASNPITVFEYTDADGNTRRAVATGRHRLDLYRRNGRKTIPARILRASEGWTAADAHMVDAVANILDGQGTLRDYADFFREAGLSRDDAGRMGLLSKDKGQMAFALANDAGGDLLSLVNWDRRTRRGTVRPEVAGRIAREIPLGGDARLGRVQAQVAAQAMAEGDMTPDDVSMLARDVFRKYQAQREFEAKGGEGEQGDLFGDDEAFQNMLKREAAVAKYRSGRADEYRDDAIILNNAIRRGAALQLRPEKAAELGVTDPNDPAQLQAARERALDREEYWRTASSLDEADAATMEREIASGAGDRRRASNPRRHAMADAGATGDIGDDVREIIGRAEGREAKPETTSGPAVVGEGKARWQFVSGRRTADVKNELTGLANANMAAQANYREVEGQPPMLVVDGKGIRVPVRGLFHAAGRRLAATGPVIAQIGDALNASAEVAVAGEWHYRVARVDFGKPGFALLTTKDFGKGVEELASVETLYSVHAKNEDAGAARGRTTRQPATDTSIADLADAWEKYFRAQVEKHTGIKTQPVSHTARAFADAAPEGAGIGADAKDTINGTAKGTDGTPPRDFVPNPADDPNFSRVPFTVADLLELARLMGSDIRAVDRIRGMRTAIGVYRARGGGAPGSIEVLRSLAKLVTPAEEAALREEAQRRAEESVREGGEFRDAGEIYRELRAQVVEKRLRNEPTTLRAVMAHEIGHLWDHADDFRKFPDGNVLAHVANLAFSTKKSIPGWLGGPAPLSKSEKDAMRRKARRQAAAEIKALVEEMAKQSAGITPQDVLNLARSAELAAKLPPELVEWFAGAPKEVKREVLRAAMKDIVSGAIPESVRGPSAMSPEERARRTRERARDLFRQAFEAEASRRMQLDVDEFKAQARELIAWWRGETFNKAEEDRTFEDYYSTADEMFAELFSCWLCNPDAMKARAPMIYQGFSGWTEARPEAAKAYKALTDGIAHGDPLRESRERLTHGWDPEEEAKEREANRRARERTPREKTDGLMGLLYRKSHGLRGAAERAAKEGGAPAQALLGRVVDAIGTFNYHGGIVAHIFNRQVADGVFSILDGADLTAKQLGEAMFHRRVVNERNEMANAQGFTAARSLAALDQMRHDLGDERFAALEAAAEKFREIYEREILEPLFAGNVFGEAAEKELRERVFYATFSVKKGREVSDDPLHDAIAERFGVGAARFLMGQKGSFADIRNPFRSTMAKAYQGIRLAARNNLARTIVEMAAREGHAVEVAKKWDANANKGRGGWRYENHRPTERQSVVGYLDGGEFRQFVVPKALAALLDEGTQDPAARSLFAWARAATNAIGGLYTRDNLSFQSVAERRDIMSCYLHLPGAKMTPFVAGLLAGNVPVVSSILPSWVVRPLIGYIPGATRLFMDGDPMRFYQAADRMAVEIMSGKMSPAAEAMLRRDFIIADRKSPRTDEYGRAYESDVGQAMRRSGVEVSRKVLGEKEPTGVWGKAKDAARGLRETVNDAGERREMRVKIMAMMFMDAAHPDMPEWRKRDIVRNMGGSPDFLEGGSAKGILSLGRQFINPAIQGTAADFRAMRENPTRYWGRKMRTTIVPALLRYLTASGIGAVLVRQMAKWMRGDDDDDDPGSAAADALEWIARKLDERKAMFDAIPDYHKQNWAVQPIGWLNREAGTVVAWRSPFEDTDTWTHRFVWAAFDAIGRKAGFERQARENLRETATEAITDFLPISPVVYDIFGPVIVEGIFGQRSHLSARNNALTDTQRAQPFSQRIGPTLENAFDRSPLGSMFGVSGPLGFNGPEDASKSDLEKALTLIRHVPGMARNLLVTNRGWNEQDRQDREEDDLGRKAEVARLQRIAARAARAHARGDGMEKADWEHVFGQTGDKELDEWRVNRYREILTEIMSGGEAKSPEEEENDWIKRAKSDRAARNAVRRVDERRRVRTGEI